MKKKIPKLASCSESSAKNTQVCKCVHLKIRKISIQQIKLQLNKVEKEETKPKLAEEGK